MARTMGDDGGRVKVLASGARRAAAGLFLISMEIQALGRPVHGHGRSKVGKPGVVSIVAPINETFTPPPHS